MNDVLRFARSLACAVALGVLAGCGGGKVEAHADGGPQDAAARPRADTPVVSPDTLGRRPEP